jgi:mannose-6-phosphate isomerase-like protein (cupin superfamily)
VRDQSSTSSAIHVGPAEGQARRIAGAQLITRKVSSEQTGGAYSLFEIAVEPKGASQPHIQHREDESFYVLEGQFEFLIEGASIETGPGSLIYVPKGHLHAFNNVGTADGRILVGQTPGGVHERFVEEAGKPVATEEAASEATEQPPEVESLAVIGAEYGVEIVSPPP